MRHEVVTLTRRRFFFLGAAAGITIAAAPLLDLFGPTPGTWAAIERAQNPFWVSRQFDGILKEYYADAIAAQLNRQNTLMSELWEDAPLEGIRPRIELVRVG